MLPRRFFQLPFLYGFTLSIDPHVRRKYYNYVWILIFCRNDGRQSRPMLCIIPVYKYSTVDIWSDYYLSTCMYAQKYIPFVVVVGVNILLTVGIICYAIYSGFNALVLKMSVETAINSVYLIWMIWFLYKKRPKERT